MGIEAGLAVHDARRRRHWSLVTLAARAGVSTSHLAEVEAGEPASLETYARLMTALDLQPQLTGVGRRRPGGSSAGDGDLVHAAMGEAQARRFASFGFHIAIDEPYQHYQFAGRADVVAWDLAARALLHIENRTRFPNVQDALGSYGAKRAYLGRVLAERLGVRGGWASETHVIGALWSSEVSHVLPLRETTFRAACPDADDGVRAWWGGDPGPLRGVTSTLVLFDPGPGVRDAYRLGVPTAAARPRYRGYADAAEKLRRERSER